MWLQCYIKHQRELKVVIEVNSHFPDGANMYKQLSYTRDLRHHTVGHFLSFSYRAMKPCSIVNISIMRGVGTQERGQSIHTSRLLDKCAHPDLSQS